MPKTVPSTPSAPAPAAPYSVTNEANGFLFVSGQVGLDPATGERERDDVAAQSARVMQNIGAILGDLGLSYSDIVKSTIFLTDMADFSTVNEVYGSFFEGAYPARSTVQVAGLPLGFLVEIEVIATR